MPRTLTRGGSAMLPLRGLALRRAAPRDQLQFFGDEDYARLFDAAVRAPDDVRRRTASKSTSGRFSRRRGCCTRDLGSRSAMPLSGLHRRPSRCRASGHPPDHRGGRSSRPRSRRFKACIDCGVCAARAKLPGRRSMSSSHRPPVPIYQITAIEADPIRLERHLGLLHEFHESVRLAGVAVPAGFRADGLPFGITLVGPDASERALLELRTLQREAVATLGATGWRMPPRPHPHPHPQPRRGLRRPRGVRRTHAGLPLNHQLQRARAPISSRRPRTAPNYRLFALPGGPPRRPVCARAGRRRRHRTRGVGHAAEHMGSFLAGVGAPPESARWNYWTAARCRGFICEGHAAATAEDITAFGGWRGFIAAATPPAP